MGGAAPLTLYLWADRESRSAAEQMALDQALAERSEYEPITVMRFYQWAASTISFGANESALRRWDRAALEAAGVPCVRRPTGGRAVWHDAADLTYAFTGPLSALGGLRQSYREVHRRLAAALGRMGLPATLAPAPRALPGLGPGACFDVAVGGEVLVGPRKVIGSAQRRSGSALLQHGAIARADRGVALQRFARRAAPRAEPMPEPDLPAVDPLLEALMAEWYEYGGRQAPEELTTWASRASVAQAERFSDAAWTWRR